MPTPEHAEWRTGVTKELRTLRKQFMFMFVIGILVAVGLAYGNQRLNASTQDIVRGIAIDRHISCINRVTEITQYNAKITLGSTVPLFPLPKCPPDPRTD